VPVDGIALSAALLDQATLTGESLPVNLASGAALCSGSINAGEAFDLLATSTAEQGTLGNIVRLVSAARQSRAPAVRLADRYALLFVPLALALPGWPGSSAATRSGRWRSPWWPRLVP
jgi:cation transport ATPase